MKTKMFRGLAAVLIGMSLPHFALAGNGQWTVVAWNNLGMHCMDDDYSVFSILPPFNTINAQVMDAAGHLVTDPTAAGITVTYQSVANPDGFAANVASIWKRNNTGSGIEQFCSGRLRDGRHTGVRDAPLDRDGIKLFNHFRGVAQALDAILGTRLGGQHRGGHEHAATFAAKGFHQGGVCKFTNHARLQLQLCQPYVQSPSNG